jgi:hypothetical protein
LLSRYINNFDEIIFCIIPNDETDLTTIKWLEQKIVEICGKSISFKIYKNTNYRESYVFLKEIVEKMSDLDGLTFFGHNKGISYSEVTEDTLKWITALYYFNLEVELPNNNMNGCCFYGALKSKDIFLEDYTPESDIVLPKYNWVYCGTFFWGKYQEISNLLKNMGREIPNMCSRWFDEMFPGNILEHYWGRTYGGCDVSKMLVLGNNIDAYILETYKDNEWVYDEFINFYNFITDEINR